MAKPTVSNPTLARLIAQSKQITADLMVLRREAAAIASARGKQQYFIDRANMRLSLILDNTRALAGEMHEIYMAAMGWDKPERSVDRMAPAALMNGRLSLCGNTFDEEE